MPSENRQLVYDFLRMRAGEGIPPTVREICAETGIKSTSTVFKILRSLSDDGLISKDPHSSRSYTVKGMPKSVGIPLVGVVTAGLPILAEQNIEDYVSVPAGLGDDLFALRVRGMSMKNAGIMDGDIVYVHQTAVAENGEIVVAMTEDGATVKRFYRENGHFVLRPENEDFEPIVCSEVSILGKVVASYRTY